MASGQVSRDEDVRLIRGIFTEELIDRDKTTYTPVEVTVFRVQTYINEIGSGEDYIQWFRWSGPQDINAVQQALAEIGAVKSLAISRQAISVAYPKGIPTDGQSRDEYLNSLEFDDAKEETRNQLRVLAKQQVAEAGEIVSTLAQWIRTRQ